jgi:transposase-like protein
LGHGLGSSASDAACRNPLRAHHGLPVGLYLQLYQKHGRTRAGMTRYECKEWRKSVSNGLRTRPKRRARSLAKEVDIFRSLINKQPIRRIGRRDEVNTATIYETIDYIHRKCLAFAAEHERRLPDMRFERLYVSTDRQIYIVNWSFPGGPDEYAAGEHHGHEV